jgi:hypothetical protein
MSNETQVTTKESTKKAVKGVATGKFLSAEQIAPSSKGSSSGYGKRTYRGKTKFHEGLDLAATNNSPQFAADGGKVVFAGYAGTAGNAVVIDHGNGVYTRYFHLNKIDDAVKKGALIAQGDKIGLTGMTGKDKKGKLVSSAPHAHVEVRTGTVSQFEKDDWGNSLMHHNPANYLGKDYSSIMTNQKANSANKVNESDTLDSKTSELNQQNASTDSTKFQSYDSGTSNTQAESSKLGVSETESSTTSAKESKNDVLKVVSLIQENTDAVKQQYGLDVTTSEGLGKAVMQYWKENNLDPKALKEQLPNMKSSDIDAALVTATKTTTVGSTKAKHVEVQRQ